MNQLRISIYVTGVGRVGGVINRSGPERSARSLVTGKVVTMFLFPTLVTQMTNLGDVTQVISGFWVSPLAKAPGLRMQYVTNNHNFYLDSHRFRSGKFIAKVATVTC